MPETRKPPDTPASCTRSTNSQACASSRLNQESSLKIQGRVHRVYRAWVGFRVRVRSFGVYRVQGVQYGFEVYKP